MGRVGGGGIGAILRHHDHRPRELPGDRGQITDAPRPAIDGRLTDESVGARSCLGLISSNASLVTVPRHEKTEFRILYDDKTLYSGCGSGIRSVRIMGSEMKRDRRLTKAIISRSRIDTFHDHRNAFYFSTNPLGAYKDANTVENGRTINYDWNAGGTTIPRSMSGVVRRDGDSAQPVRFKTTIGESTWGRTWPDPVPQERGIVLGAVSTRVGPRASRVCRMPVCCTVSTPSSLAVALSFVPSCRQPRRAIRGEFRFDADAKFGGDFKIVSQTI